MKNLLITLGDSFTEGIGCYSKESLNNYNNQKISLNELIAENTFRFKEYCWPTQLGKKINYEVLNLGKRGMANSSMSRLLIQEKYTNLKKHYDNVLVIALLTNPNRFGYFTNGVIDGLVNNSNDPTQKRFFESLSNYVKYPDVLMETAYSIRCMELFCKVYEYDFLYGSLWGFKISELNDLYTSTNNLHNYITLIDEALLSSELFLKSDYAVCSHLNEIGYEKLTDVLLKILKDTNKII